MSTPYILSKRKPSPKVIVATIAAILAPGLLGFLGYLLTDQGHTLLVNNLPPWVVILILALVPGLITFVSSYVKNDPQRQVAQPTMHTPASFGTSTSLGTSTEGHWGSPPEQPAPGDFDDS